MASEDPVLRFLRDLLELWAFQSPWLVSYLVGIALAVYHRPRAPRPCSLAILAFALMLVAVLAQPLIVLYPTRPRVRHRRIPET
jgi:hypothetical protein